LENDINPLKATLEALETWIGRVGALTMIMAGFDGWLCDHKLPTLAEAGRPTMLSWFLLGAVIVMVGGKLRALEKRGK